MHPVEQATIRAFFVPARRTRWVESLDSKKGRSVWLGRLNHCCDLDERFASPIRTNVNVAKFLRSLGAPATCYVISAAEAIDGQEMLLEDAINQADVAGWGTLISCIPGQLAYYSDEAGTKRRMLLSRSGVPSTR